MSSPGNATMVQAFENAVWPVRPISQRIDQRDARAGRTVPLGRERRHQAASPRADHQHVGID